MLVNPSYADSNEYLSIHKRQSRDGGIVFRSKPTGGSGQNDWQVLNHASTGDLRFYAYGLSGFALTLDRENANATFASTITTNSGGVIVSDVVDGDFTALRLMNQKTYGTDTGTNEKVRFVMGISESGQTFANREGFVIDVGVIDQSDSSNIKVDFQVRDGGTVGTYQTVHGHDKEVEFIADARVNGWIKGASDTNTLYSSTSLGTYLQSPANSGTGGSIFLRNHSGTVFQEFSQVAGGISTIKNNLYVQADDADFLVRSADYTISRIISRGSSGANLDKGLFSLMSSDGTNNNVEKVRIDSAGLSWFDGGNTRIGGDLEVTGNLTIQGSTTTINTQTVEVEDNIIKLNKTQGSPATITSNTSGISVYRGVDGDGNEISAANLIFDDGDDT
ncbi:MAG: hypothetical protein CMI60_16115, partial [Parvibaculum sp.]|nr:hypothetical protein [Parvibaculum sp.]